MKELAVVIQNKNQKVSVVETINSIKNAGFKNVFVQWFNRDWEYSQEEQVKLCREAELNIIFAHLGYDFNIISQEQENELTVFGATRFVKDRVCIYRWRRIYRNSNL